MVLEEHQVFEREFFVWFANALKDRGHQFSRCGFKSGAQLGVKHNINLVTGYWSDPSYSGIKPPRWLYHIDVAGDEISASSPFSGPTKIGAINTSQEDKAGVVFRVLPLVRRDEGDFVREDGMEAHLLFVFNGPTPQGSSSEPFDFDPGTGVMRYKGEVLPYIAGGLLGIKPRDLNFETTTDGETRDFTYGQVIDALATDIQFGPQEGEAGQIPVFDLSQMGEVQRLRKTIEEAWTAASQAHDIPDPELEDGEESDDDGGFVVEASICVPENPDLIGVDSGVYRQINAALQSGKRHIMLYGPPGTGKTTLARWIAACLNGAQWTLITGSSDWSSQDIIGGYQPLGGGSIAFVPGVLLRNFDAPLIIDELNRCDIDKVIGPLFTVLSGHQTTLPYRVDIEKADSPQYEILPASKRSPEKHEFAPGRRWRLLATINSIDKAALYQMSYALTRRFGWVYLDAPRDTPGFIAKYLRKEHPEIEVPEDTSLCPLAAIWTKINEFRPIGPAPIIDVIEAVLAMDNEARFFQHPSGETGGMLLDAVDMVLLPMLDGIHEEDALGLAAAVIDAFKLDHDQQERIDARMKSVAL